MSIHEWKVFEFQLTIDLSQTFFGNIIGTYIQTYFIL